MYNKFRGDFMKYLKVDELEYKLKHIINISRKSLDNPESILKVINTIDSLLELLEKEDQGEIYNISNDRIKIATTCLKDIHSDLNDIYSKINDHKNIQSINDFDLETLAIKIQISNKDYLKPYLDWIECKRINARNNSAAYRRCKRRHNHFKKTTRELKTWKNFILCNYLKSNGLKNFQIAKELNITPRTVFNHLINKFNIDDENKIFLEYRKEIIQEYELEDLTLEDDELF